MAILKASEVTDELLQALDSDLFHASYALSVACDLLKSDRADKLEAVLVVCQQAGSLTDRCSSRLGGTVTRGSYKAWIGLEDKAEDGADHE